MNSELASREPISAGFTSLADFISMGGHGFYVWLAYGVGLLVFLFLILEPVVRRRQLRTRLQAFYRREQLDTQVAEQHGTGESRREPHGDPHSNERSAV